MVASTEPNLTRDQKRAAERVAYFERQCGSETLKLAEYAAFPLTLTSDLVYCLRDRFVPECPWYGAADLLLSSLCRAIGHDLYEIDLHAKKILLNRLRSRGESEIRKLSAFMTEYIQYRLYVDGDRVRTFSNPEWTALACLEESDAYYAIVAALRELATDSTRERLRMAAMVEMYADLLPERFRPLLLDAADRVADGEPVDETAGQVATLQAAGFPMDWLEFDAARLVEVDEAAVAGETLQEFRFEVKYVDEYGNRIHRNPNRSDSLAPNPALNVSSKGIEATHHFTSYLYAEPLGNVQLEMVEIAGGTFLMGSPETEPNRFDDEGPQHEVTVPSFFLGRYPVTQAQWRFVAGLPQVNAELDPDPSFFKGDMRPVECVSWYDAVEFCDRLSAYTGRPYRLPSEAEWEYACRGGTPTPFHFGETITTDLANYDGNSTYDRGPKGENRGKTTPVDHFGIANDFGLSDMHGNVFEWCSDHWHNSYESGDVPLDGSPWTSQDESARRVIRGGSWFDNPRYCRSAFRFYSNPGYRFDDIGFRVACAAPRT